MERLTGHKYLLSRAQNGERQRSKEENLQPWIFFSTRLSTVDNGFVKDGRRNNVAAFIVTTILSLLESTTPETIDRDHHKHL